MDAGYDKTCFNAKTNNFNQKTACGAPVRWSKYTTHAHDALFCNSSYSQPLRQGPQVVPPPQLPTSYGKKLSCFLESEKFTFMILVGTFRPLKSWETLFF